MKETSMCLVKLISGEPRIGKLVGDDRFEVQFVVPGQTEDTIEIIATDESMLVVQAEDGAFSKAFELLFVSEGVDFRKFEATRHNGVVTITCEARSENTPETVSIII